MKRIKRLSDLKELWKVDKNNTEIYVYENYDFTVKRVNNSLNGNKVFKLVLNRDNENITSELKGYAYRAYVKKGYALMYQYGLYNALKHFFKNLKMDKEELKELFDNIKEGDYYYNLKIDGLNLKDTDHVLHELIREKSLEFDTSCSFDKYGWTIQYKITKPSKKFLNREGKWSMPISQKAKTFLEEYHKEEINF